MPVTLGCSRAQIKPSCNLLNNFLEEDEKAKALQMASGCSQNLLNHGRFFPVKASRLPSTASATLALVISVCATAIPAFIIATPSRPAGMPWFTIIVPCAFMN